MKNSTNVDPCYILRGIGAAVTSVSFVQQSSANCKESLITGFSDGNIKLWDLILRRPSQSWIGHNGKSILTVGLLNRETLVSHARDGAVSTWQMKTDGFVLEREFYGSDVTFCACAFTNDNKNDLLIAFPAKNSTASQIKIAAFGRKDDKSCFTLKKQQGMAMLLKWFPADNVLKLLVGLEDGSISMWDVETRKEVDVIKVFDDPVMCMDVDSTGRMIAGSAGNELKCFAIASDKGQWSFNKAIATTTTKHAGYACVSVRGDGRIVAAGGWDGRIRVFSWKSMKLLAVLKYHAETINSLSFSTDGHLAAGSKDGKISIWRVYVDKTKNS